jgi:hypothetical protein
MEALFGVAKAAAAAAAVSHTMVLRQRVPLAAAAAASAAPATRKRKEREVEDGKVEEAVAACECAAPACSCVGADADDSDDDAADRDAWTTNPNLLLLSNAADVYDLERRLTSCVEALGDVVNRSLILDVGKAVERFSSHRDFPFFQKLPPAGTKVVVLQALCPLRGATLADGADTISGAFIDSFEQAIGIPIVRCNIAIACWRKGDADGDELTGGAAGCVDPSGPTLDVLASVKRMFLCCLKAAGLDVLAFIAASNASAKALGFNVKTVEHFAAYDVGGVFEDIPVYVTPHPKFVSGACINNAGVALRIGGSLGDVLSVTSRVLSGWAQIAEKMLHDPSAEKRVYEFVRTDPDSRATVREWPLRFTSTTTPETEARLKKELREQSQKGGASPRFSHPTLSLNAHDAPITHSHTQTHSVPFPSHFLTQQALRVATTTRACSRPRRSSTSRGRTARTRTSRQPSSRS